MLSHTTKYFILHNVTYDNYISFFSYYNNFYKSKVSPLYTEATKSRTAITSHKILHDVTTFLSAITWRDWKVPCTELVIDVAVGLLVVSDNWLRTYG